MNFCKPGTLYLVATPIGNLSDFTPRAVEILKSVTFVLAEDTRSFRKLASHFGISTPVESYHEHNERTKSLDVISRLAQGASCALTSDAGTPLISDPGYHVVNAAYSQNIPVVGVPGACAFVLALAISGFPPNRFLFEGFVPQKSGRRRMVLEKALAAELTVIFYESPHRLLKSLEQLAEIAPNRQIAVARELTKLHEECVRGPAIDVFKTFGSRSKILGEIVLLISPQESNQDSTFETEEEIP